MQPKIQEDKFSYYMQGTNGKAVLLVHGLTGAPSEMRYVAKHLQRKGYTVYAPLLAGHGVTEAHIQNFKWEDWYQTVKESYYALAQNHTEVFAAGICAGGALALYFAGMNPGLLSGIALYSMTFKYDGWNIPKTRHINFLLPVVQKLKIEPWNSGSFAETHPFGIKNDRVREKVMNSATLAGCLPGFPWRSLTEMNKLNAEVKKLLPRITTPVLAIHAEDDDASSIKNACYLKSKLGGRCDLHILKDSYHMIHVDHEKDEVAKATFAFFEELGSNKEESIPEENEEAPLIANAS